MPNPKRDRISKITDEVGQLHPLLDALIRKLPGVVTVDYTHGPDEMGADFVFSRTDPVFSTHDYIALIAKVGKLGQDFTDIERQIDECSLPRTFLGGKDRIRVNEVWVLITANITKGAQEKIHEKFPNRKITFIDASRLVDLIDKYMPYYWTDVAIPAGEYLTSLRARNEVTDKSLSLVQFGESIFYLEQDVYEYPLLAYRHEMQRKQKSPRRVDLSELTTSPRLVLIEGGIGAGKSKLLRALVERLTRAEVYLEGKIVPVPTSYADLITKHAGSIASLIESAVPTLLKSDPETSFLVLLDAFDEARLTADEQVSTLASLVTSAQAAPRTRVVVTSRYLSGLDESSELENTVERYHLPPLSFKRIVEFIKAICTSLNLSSRLIEDLKKSQLFKELPHSPISAILLAKLLNENPKELPSNMTELYAQYTELVLGRWDITKGLQTLKEYEAIEQIVIRLAKSTLDYELPRLTFAEVNTIIDEYLQSRNLALSQDELFSRLAFRCEIMTTDPDAHTLSFRHRTFAEFFYAKDALRRKEFVPEEYALSLYWMNTVFFYVGLLRDCPDLLLSLTRLPPQTELERWIKVVNLSNYYLAGYASPYSVVADGIYYVFLEAARLFWEIASGKIESPLSSLPQMHLFWLTQMVIRQSYSYQFFEAALEEAALRIEASDEPDDVKAVGLFLLNVAYIDISEDETFDFLLSRFKGSLPVLVSLAIKHEAEDPRFRTALARKQIRQLKKVFFKSPQAEARIKQLYERPITQLKPPEKP